jgi:hypothetical protein
MSLGSLEVATIAAVICATSGIVYSRRRSGHQEAETLELYGTTRHADLVDGPMSVIEGICGESDTYDSDPGAAD